MVTVPFILLVLARGNGPGDTMKFKAGVFGIMVLFFTASSVLADEVLYCSDTDATGFAWDKEGNATPPRSFTPDRIKVTVKSDDTRLITPRTGESASESLMLFSCRRSLVITDRITCVETFGGEMWVFFKNTYTRAFLAGPPAGGRNPHIWMAYGTCTKF